MYRQLAYVSRAAPGVGLRECYDIIRTAHNRNRALGLTGGLLFLDGHFVQVLEGDAKRVAARFGVIAHDPRHLEVSVRADRASDRLLFAGDWMALRSAEALPPDLLARWGYAPGLPAERFDGDRLVAFVQACCAAGTALA